MTVQQFSKFKEDRNMNSPRKFQFSRLGSSEQRRFDSRSSNRFSAEKKDDNKCFKCGGTYHFAWDCNVKKNVSNNESSETMYKPMVASLKK